MCVSALCACVFIFHEYTCILLFASSQTLGSTRAWLPAPAVKHHGVLSWKSKVQDVVMSTCILYTVNKERKMLLHLSSTVFIRESGSSLQNQAE